MQSFWQKLSKPSFAMAPMADVTDPAFRALVAKCGKPDVFWTEFVSADGLYHTREVEKMPGDENLLMRDLAFTETERPIVAQTFSSDPEKIAYATKLFEELGFDGVDINMGCPDRSIEKQGAGAALMKSSETARALIRAAKEATNLPVSVKTRIGYNKEEIETWLPELLAESPAVITIHLRTRKEMSLVPAHWDLMARAVALRDTLNPDVLILGNGDIMSRAEGEVRAHETGCDGIMIGRGMFGNPWVFAGRAAEDTPLSEKLEALVELAHGFEKLTPRKNFSILKKHMKAFVTGFAGAAEMRAKLMEAENAAALEERIAQFGKNLPPHTS